MSTKNSYRFCSSSLSLVFLLLVVFRELDQDLDDLDEKIEEVEEQDHGVLWNIFVASLSSLDDELCIINDVEASNKEAAHGVDESKFSAVS